MRFRHIGEGIMVVGAALLLGGAVVVWLAGQGEACKRLYNPDWSRRKERTCRENN